MTDGKGGSSGVPEGWQSKKLSEIAKSYSGGTPSRERPDYFGQGTPWIKSGEVNQRFITSIEETITEVGLKNSSAKLVDVSTILIAMYGATAGKVGLTRIAAAINQALLAVIPDPKYADNVFLFGYLENALQKLVLTHVQGGQPNLNAQIIKNLMVLLPPLKEQRKIAEILSAWDEAIEQQTRLVELRRERKRGLMQQLLTGRVRFREFAELEWETKKLGNIATASSGGTPTSTEASYYGGSIPWVAIADITASGKYISNTEKTITQLGLENSSAKVFSKRTLLFAMYASIGKCAISTVDLSCNQAILGIRPHKEVSTEFLYYFLASQEVQYSLMGQQGTQKNLNAGIVRNFDVPCPSFSEQQKIATVLAAADAEIDTLTAQLAALKTQKRGLMQRLLTGQTRVSVA